MVVFVTGTGRSGTSTVARLLHAELGVPMGTRFRQPDKDNPDGYWEDQEFVRWNKAFLAGEVGYSEFMHRIGDVMKERKQCYETWGFKDPRLAYLLGIYLTANDDSACVICCTRDEEAVVASCRRCYGWTEEEATKMYRGRTESIANLRRYVPMTDIDFCIRRTDESVMDQVNEGVLQCRT